MEIFGIPHQAFLGQLMLGLVNGAFYAMLSLGLAVIFGLLDIVNFAHGALYMVGAFAAWIMLEKWGVSYWWSLLLATTIFLLGANRNDISGSQYLAAVHGIVGGDAPHLDLAEELAVQRATLAMIRAGLLPTTRLIPFCCLRCPIAFVSRSPRKKTISRIS